MVLWLELPKFLAKLDFIVFLHNFSRYVICVIFFFKKGSGRYGSDKKALHTDGRTDGRTYTEGRTIYVSRRGRHIMHKTEHKESESASNIERDIWKLQKTAHCAYLLRDMSLDCMD